MNESMNVLNLQKFTRPVLAGALSVQWNAAGTESFVSWLELVKVQSEWGWFDIDKGIIYVLHNVSKASALWFPFLTINANGLTNDPKLMSKKHKRFWEVKDRSNL